MGNKACTIAVQTEKTSYASGEDVNGKIYVSVTDPNGVEARTLNLCFRGEELCVLYFKTQHRKHHSFRVERETSPIFHLDAPIHSTMNGRLPEGQYEFPFRVIVPRFSPSSMLYKYARSRCNIRYFLQAYLSADGGKSDMYFNYIKQSKFSSPKAFLEITGAQQEDECKNGPIDIPPETKPVRKFLCFKTGTITLKSNVENDALIPNQTYYLNYEIQNNSTASVQGVEIRLEENIEYRANHRRKMVRTPLICLYEDANSIGNNGQKITQRLIPDMKNSKQVQLKIPREARSSHTGSLIEIYHTLRVIAKTGCCISNPESCIDVSIIEKPTYQAPYSNLQPKPTAPPMGNPRLESTAPFAVKEQQGSSDDFTDDEDDEVVEAMDLPDDWYPVKADVVHLPIASIISKREVISHPF